MPRTPPSMDGALVGRKLGAEPIGNGNARHRLTHRMAERSHAASAMRKLQFFRASLEIPGPVEGQWEVCEERLGLQSGGPCCLATCARMP